jgi:hypothetical protein
MVNTAACSSIAELTIQKIENTVAFTAELTTEDGENVQQLDPHTQLRLTTEDAEYNSWLL